MRHDWRNGGPVRLRIVVLADDGRQGIVPVIAGEALFGFVLVAHGDRERNSDAVCFVAFVFGGYAYVSDARRSLVCGKTFRDVVDSVTNEMGPERIVVSDGITARVLPLFHQVLMPAVGCQSDRLTTFESGVVEERSSESSETAELAVGDDRHGSAVFPDIESDDFVAHGSVFARAKNGQ